MASQKVCDNCGKTDPYGVDWIQLTRPPSPRVHPGGGFFVGGREELDFHHEACVVAFLQSEILLGRRRDETDS